MPEAAAGGGPFKGVWGALQGFGALRGLGVWGASGLGVLGFIGFRGLGFRGLGFIGVQSFGVLGSSLRIFGG